MKIKLLLLGASESGKSTLLKQMKLLYSNEKDFLPEERNIYRNVVFNNVLDGLKTLCFRAQANFEIESEEAQRAVEEVMQWKKDSMLDGTKGNFLRTAWEDPSI